MSGEAGIQTHQSATENGPISNGFPTFRPSTVFQHAKHKKTTNPEYPMNTHKGAKSVPEDQIGRGVGSPTSGSSICDFIGIFALCGSPGRRTECGPDPAGCVKSVWNPPFITHLPYPRGGSRSYSWRATIFLCKYCTPESLRGLIFSSRLYSIQFRRSGKN